VTEKVDHFLLPRSEGQTSQRIGHRLNRELDGLLAST
jgi:hypothetical protein